MGAATDRFGIKYPVTFGAMGYVQWVQRNIDWAQAL